MIFHLWVVRCVFRLDIYVFYRDIYLVALATTVWYVVVLDSHELTGTVMSYVAVALRMDDFPHNKAIIMPQAYMHNVHTHTQTHTRLIRLYTFATGKAGFHTGSARMEWTPSCLPDVTLAAVCRHCIFFFCCCGL